MANEKRLISLDDALAATYKEVFWTESKAADVRAFLIQQPRVDAVEVVHGRFELIEKAGVDYWRCSACQEIVAEYYHKPKYNYCPNCGAKMDGDGNG